MEMQIVGSSPSYYVKETYMPLALDSVKIGLNCDVENPACTRAELEPLLDEAFKNAKSAIFAKIENQAGDGGSCQPHDKVTFDKSTCPK